MQNDKGIKRVHNVMFSIIIPCYNVEDYIKKTIDSILKQNYKNFELILINDGSKDSTKDILEVYEKKDERIKVINKSNEGVSQARNTGIELSKGEYLYFLDGDDYVEINLLKKANFVLKNKKIKMFSFGYDVIEGKKIKVYKDKDRNEKIFSSKNFLKKFLKREIKQHICSMIIKKELLKNIRFNSELVTGEDLDFLMRVLLMKNFFVYRIDTPYFHYVRRENSATTKKVIPFKNLNTLDSLNILREKMLDKNIYEFKKYHLIRFFNIIKGLAENDFDKRDYIKIKNKLKRSEYVINDLKLEMNKENILLKILKISYKINLRLILYIFKIHKILQNKLNI